MIKVNAGCILPFYTRTIWQRHRLVGQDIEPYGLKCPNARLMPFQVRGTTGTATSVTWKLVNAVSESSGITDEISLSNSVLEISDIDGGGWYVSYFSNNDISVVPDCGFYYIVLTVSGVPYYSELLHLDGVSSEDAVSMSIDSCTFVDGIMTIIVSQDDTLSAAIANEAIYYYTNGSWEFAGTFDATIQWVPLDGTTIQLYRRVKLITGREITVYGQLTFTDDANPCDDLAIEIFNQTSIGGTELWRVLFYSTLDKGEVLYQTGFRQWFYLKEKPVFGIPTFEIDEDTKKDGFGKEITVVSNITERLPFEFFPIADFAAQGIVECCYSSDEVYLEEVVSSFSYLLKNPRYAARPETVGLSVGQITSELNTVTISCQDNKVLA